MNRRNFVKLGSVIAAASPFNLLAADKLAKQFYNTNKQIDFIHDGLLLSPKEYAELLMHLADEGKIIPTFTRSTSLVSGCKHRIKSGIMN